jgi:hypothetical protein
MLIENAIRRIPLITDIDKKIETHGLSLAMRYILHERLGICSVEVNFVSPNIKEELKMSPTLIVSNHDGLLEPSILLAYLPERKDSLILGSAPLQDIFPNLTPYFLPLHIRTSSVPGSEMKLFSRLVRAVPTNILTPPPNAHEENIATISKAATVINQGGRVVLFPQGANKNGKWKKGIGHFVQQIDANESIKVIFCHIKDASRQDILRFTPLRKLLPKPSIFFFNSISMFELSQQVDLTDPTHVKSFLENLYHTKLQVLKTYPLPL